MADPSPPPILAKDPLYAPHPVFALHAIRAYQYTEWNPPSKRALLLMGELHANKLPQLQSGQKDILDGFKHPPCPLTVYVELCANDYMQVQEATERMFQSFFGRPHVNHPELQSFATRVYDIMCSSTPKLEAMAFMSAHCLWPTDVNVVECNARHVVPYNMMTWLTEPIQAVRFWRRQWEHQKSPGELLVGYKAMQQKFERAFLKNIANLEDFRRFFHALLLEGNLPDWYACFYRQNNLPVESPIAVAFQSLAPAHQTLVRGFLDTWCQRCLEENSLGNVLTFLRSRLPTSATPTTSVSFMEAYSEAYELFSYMYEVVMDVKVLVEFYKNRHRTHLHVMYGGLRHTHRLGNFLMGLSNARHHSWENRLQPTSSVLAYKHLDDDTNLQRRLQELLTKGGSPLQPKTMMFKEAVEMMQWELSRIVRGSL